MNTCVYLLKMKHTNNCVDAHTLSVSGLWQIPPLQLHLSGDLCDLQRALSCRWTANTGLYLLPCLFVSLIDGYTHGHVLTADVVLQTSFNMYANHTDSELRLLSGRFNGNGITSLAAHWGAIYMNQGNSSSTEWMTEWCFLVSATCVLDRIISLLGFISNYLKKTNYWWVLKINSFWDLGWCSKTQDQLNMHMSEPILFMYQMKEL